MISQHLKSEDDFYVTARDGKKIFVRHAMPSNDKNKAIIIAHGIPGNPNEYIHMSARNFFLEKGYNVYRLSFYDENEKSRKLHTTTLPLQANDLNDATDSLSKRHNKIYVCGHSYGGATTLFSNPKTDANALWDSSFYVWKYWEQFEKDETTFDNELLGLSDRISCLYNKEMMKHAQQQTESSMKNLVSQISSPSIVITSGEDYFIDSGKKIYQYLQCTKDYKEIKNADHQFLNANTIKDLLNETHNWFERF